MKDQRIEMAVQRIEGALSRIAEIAEREPAPATNGAPNMAATNVSQLVVRHEEMRETVLAEIKRLDAIIERLEK